VERGVSLSTLTSSRRLLAALAIAPGFLAAVLVFITLVLLAMHGHPEGLLAAVVGAAVPVLIRRTRRLLRLTLPARVSPPSPSAELKISVTPTSARWPTTGVIDGPRVLALP
jgi:hypothetical protein